MTRGQQQGVESEEQLEAWRQRQADKKAQDAAEKAAKKAQREAEKAAKRKKNRQP